MTYSSTHSDDPGSWLGGAIAATLCCCTPLGIVGIVYAALAMDARKRGDHGLAADRLRLARLWTLWAVGLGIAGYCLSFLLSGASDR